MSKATLSPNQIILAEAQHIGYNQQRKTLEDRCKSIRVNTPGGLDIYLGVVADGIGGASAGEAAGQILVDTVIDFVQRSPEKDINTLLRNALLTAHQKVRKTASENVHLRSMGTTATVVAICRGKLHLAHVGDSRAYLVRQGQIQQLTMDHSWANERVRTGQFTMEEVRRHPRRDELARYIGQPSILDVDVGLRLTHEIHPAKSTLYTEEYPLQVGDTVILCTDGLTKERRDGKGYYVDAHEIVEVIERNAPQDAANTLVSLALGRQVDDNISVVVMEVPGKRKKIGLPVGISPKLIVAGVLIVGLFIIMGLLAVAILPGMLAAPVVNFTPTVPPGFVSVMMESGSDGTYYTPGKSPQQLAEGFRPIEANTQIQVKAGVFKLLLPDGTSVYSGKDTIFRFEDLVDLIHPQNKNVLALERGSILMKATGGEATVRLPNGLVATVRGSVMGVEYLNGVTAVDCFEGRCTVGRPNQPGAELTGGKHVSVDNNGRVTDIDLSKGNPRVEFWLRVLGSARFSELGIYGTPTPVPSTATVTPPQPTVDRTRSFQATQQCGNLQRLGTPCPPAR